MLWIVTKLVLIHHCSLNWMHLSNKWVVTHLRYMHRLVYKLLRRKVSLRLCDEGKIVKSTKTGELLACPPMMHLISHLAKTSHHPTHVKRIRNTNSSIKHRLNVIHLLLLIPQFFSKISDHVLFLNNMRLLFVIFTFQLFFDLTHQLSLFKSPLLL